MAEHRSRSPLRLLAPLALATFAVAFFGILLAGGDGDDTGGSSGTTATDRQRSGGQRPARRPRPRRRTYTVKVGDTLGAIAVKTGLTVERLEELNPEVDPQALVQGQKIKLRE